MTTTAIISMIIGLTITWGGLALVLLVQINSSKKDKK